MSLSKDLHSVLSATFRMYLKAHSYHWNVEGNHFQEYHSFFGSLYESLFGELDVIAEHIRAIDEYVTFDGEKVKLVSSKDAITQTKDLKEANDEIVSALNVAFKSAEKERNQGVMDFVAGYLDSHAKLNWQLNAMCKNSKMNEDILKPNENIVEVNGFKIVKDSDMYIGLLQDDKVIRSAYSHYTLTSLIDELLKGR